MDKKLSIIVPVYKVEQYLEKCLSSILNQVEEREDIELVVVNDGSPDNSQAIIDKYYGIYPHIIVPIKQQNQGLSMARNNGLEKATGDYVWFVDSDDWLLDNALKIVFDELEKNPDIDVYSSFLKEYYEVDDAYKVRHYDGPLIMTGLDYLRRRLPIGAAQRYIYKRDFLLKNDLRFIPGILHEDNVWGNMILYKANLVKFLSEPVYVYRLRTSGSIMSSITVKSGYDLIKGHRILMNWMGDNVAEKDQPLFQYLIFGLINCALDFCRDIIKTKEYRTFLNENKQYIHQQTKQAIRIKKSDISLYIIFISPDLFSILCKLLNK